MSAATKRMIVVAASVLSLGIAAVSVQAAPRGGVVVVPRVVYPRVVGPGPYWYDPFWGPWYPGAYAYPVYGRADGNIKTSVTPKDAEVFVDGYYAGKASDFDGAFSRLHVAPGGHQVALYLNGFRTVFRDIYVRPDSTFKMNESMNRLNPGETSASVPAPQGSNE